MSWIRDKLSEEDIISVNGEGFNTPIAKFVSSTQVGYAIVTGVGSADEGISFIVQTTNPFYEGVCSPYRYALVIPMEVVHTLTLLGYHKGDVHE